MKKEMPDKQRDFWYPDWEFYRETHELMLDIFGGQRGNVMFAEKGFNTIIDEVKKVDDIWDQAAHMLYRLRHSRLVEDAQKRTAYTVTATFLETNGYAMAEKEEAKIIRFIKYDMLHCDESQIKEWMKGGKIPKSAQNKG